MIDVSVEYISKDDNYVFKVDRICLVDKTPRCIMFNKLTKEELETLIQDIIKIKNKLR